MYILTCTSVCKHMYSSHLSLTHSKLKQFRKIIPLYKCIHVSGEGLNHKLIKGDLFVSQGYIHVCMFPAF